MHGPSFPPSLPTKVAEYTLLLLDAHCTQTLQVVQERQESVQWLLHHADAMVELHALLRQVKDVCQLVRGRLMPSQVFVCRAG